MWQTGKRKTITVILRQTRIRKLLQIPIIESAFSSRLPGLGTVGNNLMLKIWCSMSPTYDRIRYVNTSFLFNRSKCTWYSDPIDGMGTGEHIGYFIYFWSKRVKITSPCFYVFYNRGICGWSRVIHSSCQLWMSCIRSFSILSTPFVLISFRMLFWLILYARHRLYV